MVYSIKVEQVGESGTPRGRPALYEADTETEAVARATDAVHVGPPGIRRVATVLGPSGTLILAYAGRSQASAGRTAWSRARSRCDRARLQVIVLTRSRAPNRRPLRRRAL